ncbi:MAG TPA: DUF1571 domain-containing protein [Polyangia bacterium]
MQGEGSDYSCPAYSLVSVALRTPVRFAIALGAISPTWAEQLSPGQALAGRVIAMSEPERVRSLAALPVVEHEAFFRSLSVADIVALGRQSLAGLDVYHARVIREERVRGHLYGPDVVEVTVREKPHAVLLEFVAGTHKGRRALYNAELRPHEMLARESGILGLFAMWLSLDGSIARRYTNHTIAEVGFGPMIDVMQAEQTKAATAGGYRRSDEGFDGRGLYCMFFTAPTGAKGLYATRLRYCVEGKLGLPMKIEVFDENGRREYVEYQDLQKRLPVKKEFFTPQGAGF